MEILSSKKRHRNDARQTENQSSYPRGELERPKYKQRTQNALGVFIAHDRLSSFSFKKESLLNGYRVLPLSYVTY